MISIKHKLVASHVSSMLLVAVMTIAILATLQFQHMQKALNNRANTLAQSHAKDFAELLTFNTNEKAINFTTQLQGLPDVVYLFVSTPDGQQIFSYHSPTAGNDKKPIHDLSLNINTHEYLKPINYAGRQIGSIRVALSTDETRAARDAYIQVLMLLIIGIVLFSVLLSWWIQKIFTSAIIKLTKLTRKIAETGDYSKRINVKSNDEIGALYYNFNQLLDATEKAESELVQQRERMHITLSSLAEGVVSTDEMGMVQYLNPVAEETLGCKLSSAIGQSIDSLLSIIPSNELRTLSNPIDDAITQNQIIVEQANSRMRCHTSGEDIEIEYSVSPIRNQQQQAEGAVFIFRDMGKTRELARQLVEHVQHDSLTGFYSREYFEVLLDQTLAQTQADGSQQALFYVDLDRFKVINEAHGFVAGDGLIRSIAGMLKDILDDEVELARLGSDEFGILVKNCNSTEAHSIANKLVSYIGNYPFIWEQIELSVQASVGVIYIDEDSENALKLIANAGMACMTAKETGGNRSHFYQPDDINMARRMSELRWVEKIKIALQEDKFDLYYQPMVPLDCSKESRPMFEILIRYRNSNNEIIGPVKFLPAAEKHNLMPEIDRWVIQALLAACKPGASEFGDVFNATNNIRVSVNLSGQSLGDTSFHEFVIEQFEAHQVNPSKFCFEITETAAISSLSRAHKFIQTMRKLGCTFSLDDFGTGMSSFSYLKNLPVDYLKIDGSYVKDIVKVPADYELVKAVNQIGKVLNMQTIAEFVEDDKTAALLTEIGVDYGQGYFYAIPSPLHVTPEIYCPTTSKQDLSV